MFRERLPRLEHGDTSLLRGRIEGLGAVDAWFRFGDTAHDGRGAARRIARIVDDVVALAKANGFDEIAATFATQASEHFAQVDATAPDDESPAQRKARLQRARRRRETLLASLDRVLAAPTRDPKTPFLSDPVDLWLLGDLPTWLLRGRARTLDGLGLHMRAMGHRWYVHIPHLGAKKAARIVEWWQDRREWLGDLPADVRSPRRELDVRQVTPKPALAIAPLERFSPPDDDDPRSGAWGSNRAPREVCQLQARNDYEAIQAWLSRKPANSPTWRSYRREAERFLLWAVLHRGKALSSLHFEDCIAYREFMSDPDPAWVRNVKGQPERYTSDWRPFAGPLGTDSLHVAQSILRAMCQFLKDTNYLAANPWVAVPGPAPALQTAPYRGRSLPEAAWSLLVEWLHDPLSNEPGPATQRLQFIVLLAYTTGLRLAELAAARVSDLHQLIDRGEAFWMLRVVGKGKRARDVPVPETTISALRDYLAKRGHRADLVGTCAPEENEIPVLSRLQSDEPLTPGRIYEILKDAFTRCAAIANARDKKAAATFLKASTHWLRHTYGTHATSRGVELSITRDNMGHASLATTSKYLTTEEGKRARAIRRAFDRDDSAPAD